MYSIGNVIYGVPWNDELYAKVEEALQQNEDLAEEYSVKDIETMGIETSYHGSSPRQIGWIGKMYEEIDECSDVSLTELMANLEAKRSQFEKDYESCLANVPEFLKELLGKPDLYIVWSTS